MNELARIHGLSNEIDRALPKGVERGSDRGRRAHQQNSRWIRLGPAGLEDVGSLRALHRKLGYDQIERGSRFGGDKVLGGLEHFRLVARARQHAREARAQLRFVLDQGQTDQAYLLKKKTEMSQGFSSA